MYPLKRSLSVRLGPRSSAHPVCEEMGGETRGGRQEEEGKVGRREGGKEGGTRGGSGFSVAGYTTTLPIYFPLKTTSEVALFDSLYFT